MAGFQTGTGSLRGWVGDLMVSLQARLFLDRRQYHLFRNVTLPTEDSTTGVDHIIVSKYGIFIVETKNLKGVIQGGPEDGEWTLQNGAQRYTVANPLHQHQRHARALEAILGLAPHKVFPLIVFVGGAAIGPDTPGAVTGAGGYLRCIRTFSEPRFGESEVAEIIKKLRDYRADPGTRITPGQLQKLHSQPSRTIRKKLRKARRKQTSIFYRFAVIAALLLLFGAVAKKTVIDRREVAGPPHNGAVNRPVPAELNTIYRYRDDQGKTRYSNAPAAPGAELVDEPGRAAAGPVPVAIDGEKILIPVTITHREFRMETVLILDQTLPLTLLPAATADLLGADKLGSARVRTESGAMVSGTKRRVDALAIGDRVVSGFTFLAVDRTTVGRDGLLGQDFGAIHPFSIDRQAGSLIWE